MTYDPLGEMTQITLSGNGVLPARVNMTFDAAGELTNLTRYADLAGTTLVASSAYKYDADGNVMSLTDAHGGTTLASYAYTYDADSRVTKETSVDGTSSYTYNAANELTSATAASQSQPAENYSYDANGNRTGTSVSTGKNNELLSDGTYKYTYDADGNLIQKTDIATGAVTQYSWDYRNRLTSVVFKNASGTLTGEVEYTYDVFNNRIGESVQTGSQAPVVDWFVYDGDNLALEFNGAGALTDRYLYGPAVDQVLADESSSGKISWYLTDDLGSVRDVINSTGTLLDHIAYNSYGQVLSQTNAAAAPLFGFTGQVFDQATGLYFDQARYYDPSTGRFISQDPSSFGGGDTNLYRYVGNAPTDGTDPTGLSTWDRTDDGTGDEFDSSNNTDVPPDVGPDDENDPENDDNPAPPGYYALQASQNVNLSGNSGGGSLLNRGLGAPGGRRCHSIRDRCGHRHRDRRDRVRARCRRCHRPGGR